MTDLWHVDGEWILGVLLSVFISYCSHHSSSQLILFHVSLFVNMFLHLSLFFHLISFTGICLSIYLLKFVHVFLIQRYLSNAFFKK